MLLIARMHIPCILKTADALAALVHSNHIVYLCSWVFIHLPPSCFFKFIGYIHAHKVSIICSFPAFSRTWVSGCICIHIIITCSNDVNLLTGTHFRNAQIRVHSNPQLQVHIAFIVEIAGALTAFIHPNRIVYLCSWG